MRKIFIFLLIYFFFISLNAIEVKFEKIQDGLNNPWSLSFVDKENIIFTEKTGKLYLLNLKNKNLSEVEHNLSILNHGQGGLLDVLYLDEQVYISYSENRGEGKSSTSVAKENFQMKKLSLPIFLELNLQLTLATILAQD